MEKMIGVIDSVRFGFGGYQEAMFGLTLSFSADGYGVETFLQGGWTTEITKSTKWTEIDRGCAQAAMCSKLIKILRDAKVGDVSKLKGKPVELTFDKQTLHDWRILKEAIL